MKKVAITGMEIISAIGNDLDENLNALIAEKDGIGFPEILQTNHRLLVGEIRITNENLAEMLQLGKDHLYTRAALLAVKCIQNLQHTCDVDFDNMAFINGTSVGGIDAVEKNLANFQDKDAIRWIKSQHPGFTTNKIARYFNINSYHTTISTACSSSANAILHGAELIKSGKYDRVIVGGVDCLTKFTLNGFNSLKILSEEKARPFDANRNGLNLGEAAAFLILENAENLNGKKPLGYLKGWGNANDAFHQTASSPQGEGAFLSMEAALKVAGISASEIDYLNAHGTGTENNDLSESNAIKRVFSDRIPAFSSTKAYTGHTLGAAGAVEAVFSLLMLREQMVFPNLNFKKGISETGLLPVTQLKSSNINHVMSNSFGFGGNCTSLIFEGNE